MNIAADSFAEIFAALASSAHATPSNDKRRATRYEYPAQIRITPCDQPDGAEPIMVGLRNFSTRGVCVISDRQFPRGSQFIAELPRKNLPPVQMLCTIVHARVIPDGGFALGAEFTCMVTPEQSVAAAQDIDRIRQSILA